MRVFQGQILQESSALSLRAAAPLEGITVIISDTGDFDRTDSDGRYSITTGSTSQVVRYLFVGDGIDAEFTLDNVDPGAMTVSVDFNVAVDGRSVSPARIDVSDDPVLDEPSDDDVPDGNPPGLGDDDDMMDDSNQDKVTICHLGKQTLEVAVTSLQAHIRHGDSIGECLPDSSPKPPKPDRNSGNG